MFWTGPNWFYQHGREITALKLRFMGQVLRLFCVKRLYRFQIHSTRLILVGWETNDEEKDVSALLTLCTGDWCRKRFQTKPFRLNLRRNGQIYGHIVSRIKKTFSNTWWLHYIRNLTVKLGTDKKLGNTTLEQFKRSIYSFVLDQHLYEQLCHFIQTFKEYKYQDHRTLSIWYRWVKMPEQPETQMKNTPKDCHQVWSGWKMERDSNRTKRGEIFQPIQDSLFWF